MSIPFWDIVGDTIVTPQYVRLTPDDKSRNAGLWNQVVRTDLYGFFPFLSDF